MSVAALIALFGANPTWSTTDKSSHIALTNAGLTAAVSGGANNRLVRATVSRSTGKYYFETVFTTPGGDLHGNEGVGFFTGSVALDDAASLSTDGIVVVPTNGLILNSGTALNSGNQLNGGVSFPTGSVICHAIDIGSSKYWARLGASGQWNASGTANPATGSGGYSYTVTAALFPGVIFETTAADTITANFGPAGFAGTPPSGFDYFS